MRGRSPSACRLSRMSPTPRTGPHISPSRSTARAYGPPSGRWPGGRWTVIRRPSTSSSSVRPRSTSSRRRVCAWAGASGSSSTEAGLRPSREGSGARSLSGSGPAWSRTWSQAGPVGAQGVLAGSVGGVELVRGAVVGAQPVADRPHSGAFEAFHQVRGEVARVPVLVGDRVDEGQDVGGGALGVLTADEGDEPVAGVALGVGLDERGAGFGHVPPERLLGVGAARPYLFEEFTQQGASHGGHLGSGGSREGGRDGRGAAGWTGHVRAALRRGWRPSGRAAPRGGTGRRGRW